MLNLPIKIKNIRFLDKGKRSLVYTGLYKKKKVAIKLKNPKSEAKNRLANEANYLRILNKHNMGPKLIKAYKECIIYEFVEGKKYIDLIKGSNQKKARHVSKKVLKICRELDKLKINKLEFTRPIKHVFIKDNKAQIIDFERCYKTRNPKNVTQFCQFLMSNKIIKKDSIIELLKDYKNKQSDNNFKKILETLD